MNRGLLFFAALVIIFGVIGFADQMPPDQFVNEWYRWAQIFYRTATLFIFDTGHLDYIGRLKELESEAVEHPLIYIAWVLGPMVTLTVILKLLWLALSQTMMRTRLRFTRNHIVYCGLGTKAQAFARNDKDRVSVAIEVSPDAARETFARARRLLLWKGDASERSVLMGAGVARAGMVIVATGDDTRNLQIALAAADVAASCRPDVRERPWWHLVGRAMKDPLEIYVSVTHPILRRQLLDEDRIRTRSEASQVHPFSTSELAARALFKEVSLAEIADLRGQEQIHALFFGFGDMGTSLLVHMIRGFTHADLERPMATVFCQSPACEEAALKLSYPEIGATATLRFEAVTPGAVLPTESALVNALRDAPATAVFIAQPSDDEGLAAALALKDMISRNAILPTPIFVRLDVEDGLNALITPLEKTAHFEEVLMAFGGIGALCRLSQFDRKMDRIAEIYHDAYVANRLAMTDDDGRADTDATLRPWATLSETYRESNRRAAEHIPAKILSAGGVGMNDQLKTAEAFRLAASDVMRERIAALEHRSWNVGRSLDGWRLGRPRNNARKLHDCLVPYGALSEAIKDYDREQIDLLDTKVLKRSLDQKNEPAKNGSLIRQDFWLGLIGSIRAHRGDQEWLTAFVNERLLPPLLAMDPDLHMTVVTPLAPGCDLLLARAVKAALVKADVPYRFLFPLAVPIPHVVHDFEAAWKGGWHHDGSGENPSVTGSHPAANDWSDVREQAEKDLADFVESEPKGFVIPLSPHTPQTEADHQRGYRHQAAFVVDRCDQIVAAVRGDVDGTALPGGTAEAILWRKGLRPRPVDTPTYRPRPKEWRTGTADIVECRLDSYEVVTHSREVRP
ncbi:MAG: RyR domain-containing protein [Pseudomonadota bacterium]